MAHPTPKVRSRCAHKHAQVSYLTNISGRESLCINCVLMRVMDGVKETIADEGLTLET